MTTPTDPTPQVYAQRIKPDEDEPSPGLGVSTFSRVRLHINAAEMVCDWEILTLPPFELGVFMRLLPHAVYGDGIPADLKILARFLAPTSPRLVRKAWPALEPFFHRAGDNFQLKERDWLKVELKPVTPYRVPLRHLYQTLVEFWGEACVYCGVDGVRLHIEHIVPKARGGGDALTNLTLACHSCNSQKATKTAAEFGHPHVHDQAKGIQ